MHNANRWIEGSAASFDSNDMPGVWIVRRVVGNNVTFASVDSDVVIAKTTEELNGFVAANEVQFYGRERINGELILENLCEADQLEVARRWAYVKGFINSGEVKRSKAKLEPIIQSVSSEIKDSKPPAWNTFNNWIKAYMEESKLEGLFPRHHRKGDWRSKLDPRVKSFIDESKPFYYKKSQILMSSIHRVVEAKVLEHNFKNPSDKLDIPAYSTVQYWVEKSSYQDYVRGRVGSNRARYEFSDIGVAPKTTRILERVEADHTPLDINVLHDEKKTLLGRPTLTVLIDHYSRMVVGFQISFEEPSYASASMAISCSILQKDELLESYGLQGEWPAHGVMETMVADNGSEFWGGNMDLAIGEVGSVLQYAPVRSPNYKGVVERFFRTLKTMLIDALPGKTNGAGNGSDEYDPQSEAKLTLSEFKKRFLIWLVNIYHLEPTGDAVQSPLDLWNESASEFPVVKEDKKRIETILMSSDVRTLQRDGIQLENLKYNSSALRDIYRRDGVSSLPIKFSHFDIGYIYVFDESNGIYIPVRCTEYEYAKGLSMYAHKAICRRANAQRKSYKENAVLQKAKVEVYANISELHERNVRRKTQVSTKKAARLECIGIDEDGDHPEIEVSVIDNSSADQDFDEWEVW